MHKWNMFKRTAPIVLSLVVAATSAPSTVLAVDAFEDGTAVEFAAEDTAATTEAAQETEITDTAQDSETAEFVQEPETVQETEEAPAAEETQEAPAVEETEEAAAAEQTEMTEAAAEETTETEMILDAEGLEETAETDEAASAGEEIAVFSAGEETAATEVFAAEASSEYTYLYAGLTWNEYWASEKVYAAGIATSSTETDSKSEYDKGGFDTVTRATTNHGLHRGSFQMMATIIASDGTTYEVASWSSDGKTLYLTDGSSVGYSKGTITKADGSTATLSSYEVTGIKYVPVKVKTSDLDAFKAKYRVVENGGTLAGGYSEKNLSAYTAVANVTENTNGLKTATKNADGSFSFSARATGTASGLSSYTGSVTRTGELAVSSDLTYAVHSETKTMGAYGEFLRVNITGNYGDLGANMQAVRWDYYGSGDTVLASYGTKFAADNWMHKSNGIQLGLTNSIRCKLPAGTDGTGKWVITIYALGYQDTTITVNVDSTGLASGNLTATESDLAEAKALVTEAEALTEADYSADSWKTFQAELQELKDLLASTTTPTSPSLNEQMEHLQSAIEGLVKRSVTVAKTTVNLNLKKSTTIKPVLTGFDGTETVTYKSSNKKVAAVNSKGKVTAKKTGKAVITVSCGNCSAEVTVYVNEKLTLKKSSATIKVKKKTTIKASTNIKGTITYTSNNTKVATVSKKGVVKGVKKGTATITVKCNGKTKKFKVTVK